MQRLWYFADPMCSWCWGFAPVVSAIERRYRGRLGFELVMGGLRPGTTAPVTPAFRDEILHHWHDVERLTGQSFRFEGALPQGFVYDTEPPCRAVVAFGALRPQTRLAYFESIQSAFYAGQRDVTRADTLAALAEDHGIGAAEFLETFSSPAAHQATASQFRQTAQIGIRGFPTVVLQNDAGPMVLTGGYRPLPELASRIDAWLATRD
jgi:putative protein-disulfide isomerase